MGTHGGSYSQALADLTANFGNLSTQSEAQSTKINQLENLITVLGTKNEEQKKIIDNLLQNNNTLREEMQNMANQNTALAMAKPFKYEGGTEEAEQWISAVNIYLHRQNLTSDRNKIEFALTYISHTSPKTSDWVRSKNKLISDHHENEELPYPFKDWKEFVVEFLTRFGEKDSQGKAQSELSTIKAKYGEAISDFNVRFKILAYRSGYDTAALKRIYITALPKPLRDRVFFNSKPKEVEDWDGWMHTAEARDNFERTYYEEEKNRTTFNPIRPKPYPRPFYPRPQLGNPYNSFRNQIPRPMGNWNQPPRNIQTPENNAMDVDRTKKTPFNKGNVTCYRCQQKGHYSYECTTPLPTPNNTFRGRTNVRILSSQGPDQYRDNQPQTSQTIEPGTILKRQCDICQQIFEGKTQEEVILNLQLHTCPNYEQKDF